MGFIQISQQTEPSAPSAGEGLLYPDSVDGKLKMKNPDGQVYTMTMSGFDKNLLINGGFDFYERQAPGTLTTRASTTARVMGPDQWGMTGAAASLQCIRVDTQATPETGLFSRYYGRFLQITGASKICLSQVIEGHPSLSLRGRKVRFQAKIKRVGGAFSVRLGLVQLANAGTIDALPATFISAFNGAITDPTFGTNLALVAPDANSATGGTVSGNAVTYDTTTSWLNVSGVWTVPSNCKNLVPVIFSDGNLAVNDELHVGEAGMYEGPDVCDWNPMPIAVDLERARRFYQKTFGLDVAPVQNAGVTSGQLRCILGKAAAIALAAQFQWRFTTALRANGTATTFNPAVANAAVRQISGTAGDLTATAVANQTNTSLDVTATGIATGAVGDQCGVHVAVDAAL